MNHPLTLRLIAARANECARLAHAYNLAAMDSLYRYNEYAIMGVANAATALLETARDHQKTGMKYSKLAMDYRISLIGK